MFRRKRQYRRSEGDGHGSRWRRLVLWGFLAILSLAALANIAMWIAYRERVLPNYSLGSLSVGNTSYSELEQRIEQNNLLPQSMELRAEGKTQTIRIGELGITVDKQASLEALRSGRNFLPLLSLFRDRTVPVELSVVADKFDSKTENLAQIFHKNTLPERVVFSGENFKIASPEAGYQMNKKSFKKQILSDIQRGRKVATAPTQVIDAPEVTGGLDQALQDLRKKLQVTIKFKLGDKEVQPTVADIGGWFVQDGQTMAFSVAKADEYIKRLESSLFNADDAASAVGYAMDSLAGITFVLATEQTPAKYTYCANLKAVDESNKTGFVRKVAAILGDPRGWNAGGSVAFQRVDSGCDFDLWLSAPGQMTSFGGLCDPFWSCRSGRNVVINFDRWQGATDAWNNAGGGLEDYRVMVTNHEVGHWLGFGHRNCPGPGQPAPVMMQQSIDLKGCTFNPWPVEDELNTLKQVRGLAVLPPREDLLAVEPCCCASCGSRHI